MSEEKDNSEENRRRVLVALAILLGARVENRPESLDDVPRETLEKARALYEERNMALDVEQPARIPEREVQIKVAEAGQDADVELYRIVGQDDERTCPDCAAWRGRTVAARPDGVHKTVQDFINGHGFHVNCRCALQPLDVSEIKLNRINPRYEERAAANPRAYNSSLNGLRLVFN